MHAIHHYFWREFSKRYLEKVDGVREAVLKYSQTVIQLLD